MINGIGYPKFYIYDSTGVTLQTIPENISASGVTGVISLTKRVIVNEKQPDRYDIVNESPYTRTELREFLGYKYKCSLTVVQEDYLQGLLQYSADQATTKVTDIYKLKAIEAYANAGYKIKFTPHNDLEDLWGSQFPIWVDVKITRTGKSQRIYSDSFSMEVHGTTLLDSPYPFTAFSFTTSSGILNANQCLLLNGTDESATLTATNCGKTYSIEFWLKTTITSSDVLLSNAGGNGLIQFDATKIYHAADGTTQASKTLNTPLADQATHIVIKRNNSTTIEFYQDGVSLGTATIDTNADMTPSVMFMRTGGTLFIAGRIRAFRVYQRAITDAEVVRQYNSGYGNWPLDTAAFLIYEFDGTGGTGVSTETDQSGNGKTLTLANSPTRTTW